MNCEYCARRHKCVDSRRVLVCLFVGVSRFRVFAIVFLLRSFIWSYLSSIIINYCRDCFWIEIDQRDKSHGLTPCSASMRKTHTLSLSLAKSTEISIRRMWINTLEKHIESVITELGSNKRLTTMAQPTSQATSRLMPFHNSMCE